ncbi:MAG: 30S ribosomal protein S6 [Candidatus Gottesmanbacteria bacterium GW2011_GWB1_43_11]|uniref:Small ribosomal subunit protein bS6 n=1 Tax=Candidatus Gottesmanbacteria bacterium GW2011_GWB1_43_11 TaxID=1618446 RepID=A0A0G1CLM2_9BACT|nr:MAG: 30S ribosomal protein S6 [Candidatus Gottesmanbacteria bacterium GW2011_GWA2_42_16]KKS54934.1 MAG: 30S ribosomal protein S6 [Candidatus Gottesmanbacteria bacterium GW2011_GWA1_42_26]KKS82124.1 MAG: 30S ribosomal protein S6 [Candidatus Gottesmanbacteria bacterium GW2011_GWC1_43_10]KKS86640.1 MAG: 30S ribosomal protein S6 [Candidatus Gottesmanbacteria bacterium GW2011_GWB1_43_11]OGG10592.1 MAG: 30S ribosomal protein S6 [Candidatus Gottesmanbacteria bacterium RIFCSPHIGHO2_01_FULL_43_15]OG
MQYELVLVVKVGSDIAKASEAVKDLLEKTGYSIAVNEDWGKKKLAYPLKKQTEGHYLYFTIAGTVNPNLLHTKFKQDESILRMLVVRKEEEQNNNQIVK